jgi:hypothetical protein
MQIQKPRGKTISPAAFNQVSALYETFSAGLDDIIDSDATNASDITAIEDIAFEMLMAMVKLRAKVAFTK